MMACQPCSQSHLTLPSSYLEISHSSSSHLNKIQDSFLEVSLKPCQPASWVHRTDLEWVNLYGRPIYRPSFSYRGSTSNGLQFLVSLQDSSRIRTCIRTTLRSHLIANDLIISVTNLGPSCSSHGHSMSRLSSPWLLMELSRHELFKLWLIPAGSTYKWPRRQNEIASLIQICQVCIEFKNHMLSFSAVEKQAICQGTKNLRWKEWLYREQIKKVMKKKERMNDLLWMINSKNKNLIHCPGACES